MKEIYNNLFIGNEDDYNVIKTIDGFNYVLAAKEPFHRQMLGYTGRAAPKDHPEYLYGFRYNKIILNIVDAPKPEFFADKMIDAALLFIHSNIATHKVAIICNQGKSRSAIIGLLYMIRHDLIDLGNSFEECEKNYKMIYPDYEPLNGIREYVKQKYGEIK